MRRTLISYVLVLGCGPSVVTSMDDSGGGTGSSGAPDESSSTTATTILPSTTADPDGSDGPAGSEDSTDSGMSIAVCGDGVLHPKEECDDGNDADDDGCNHRCEPSGSLRWSVDLSPGAPNTGGGVGLDVRETDAFVLVQEYRGVPGAVVTSRVNNAGDLLGAFTEPQAFADWDFVRSAIAGIPEGDAAVGYSVGDRGLARVRPGDGLVWDASLAGFEYSYATMWSPSGVFTLRGSASADQELTVVRFSEDGEFLDELPLGAVASVGLPLLEGGMVSRPLPTIVVLTFSRETGMRINGALLPPVGSGSEVLWDGIVFAPDSADDNMPPRAFSHEAEIVVWTEDERIVIDMLDHIQPATPRVVRGEVLVSFPGGFAIREGEVIAVYDDEGAERWRSVGAATPRLARADGDGGLFVLSDKGWKGEIAVLEYYAL